LATPSIPQTLSAESGLRPLFPLPWSHYVRLLSVADPEAREYYEREALQGGWSVRQLDRQIASLAYRRTRRALSVPAKDEILPADAHLRDPFILEFLNLKDEYSETDLEDALIGSLQQFLLELGNDFAFVARQRRLRVGTEWYRVDLVFFHRRLRCLVIVDLKLGKFTHADAGQMNLYLNYASEHWTQSDENPPVGLILCSEKDAAVAHYALGNLSKQILAREYKLSLPDAREIAARIDKTRRLLSG
jgi:predicted nuclease of restriction endonuclease-like (RecB) superfamily